MDRRGFIKAAAVSGLSLPFWRAIFERRAFAAPPSGVASRIIFFYFPDGVAGPSSSGDPSLWHCTGTENDFTLGAQLAPLEPYKQDCVFFTGLSMGPTDSGGHAGGAKKLLTATDFGNGESIDQFLARTAGANAPFRHVYLGAMADENNPSGDMHISYPTAGQSTSPEDDPLTAFRRIFQGGAPQLPNVTPTIDPRITILDSVMDDLSTLEARLGTVEKQKLDLHLDAVREVEARIKNEAMMMNASPACQPTAPVSLSADQLYAPEQFPAILRAQSDLLISAMACGLTQVGVLQCSMPTSDLIMSRFMGTEMYDPAFDMRSHQASHYGGTHDYTHREFSAFMKQGVWWVSQFAYLLDRLKSIPEGDGTMLDHSLVFLGTEICDGNTHSHDNMPFVIAGRAGGAVSTGRFLSYDYERHGNLWVSVARAMGQSITQFGDSGTGPLDRF
jgi:hypothetical protein